MLQTIYDFLDKFVLPWPVRYLSHRFVILLTIALLLPLIVYANNQTLVLLINSYLNTMSVAVSSIVLLYATISEIHQKQIAELQEKRAQEDHTHVTQMHSLMQQTLIDQQKQIESLKEMLAALHGKEYTPQAAPAAINLHELHPRGAARFENHEPRTRITRHLHPHAMTEQVHKTIVGK